MTQAEILNASLAATNIKGFAELVKAMREAQRDYFRTRAREALLEAKSLEMQVDAAVKMVLGDGR